MDKDYKEKIRKLLALAESPNEHEARAALLKARQLMAEHKLTETEVKDVEKQQVKDVRTDITCSKRRDPWIVSLSAIIGENYCRKGYRYRRSTPPGGRRRVKKTGRKPQIISGTEKTEYRRNGSEYFRKHLERAWNFQK